MSSDTERLKPSTVVSWQTYRHGSGKHTASVMGFVPAGEPVPGLYPNRPAVTGKLGDFLEYTEVDRYLMREERPGRKVRYFCPPASRIEKALKTQEASNDH